MANPITDNVALGAIGELFAQIRLLELGWQAAPPLKDSGNDLIAIKGDDVLFLQVKTTKHNNYDKPRLNFIWDAYIYVCFDESSPTPYDSAETKILSRPVSDKPITNNWRSERLMNLDESSLNEVAMNARSRKLRIHHSAN